jgi:hypothetical protein
MYFDNRLIAFADRPDVGVRGRGAEWLHNCKHGVICYQDRKDCGWSKILGPGVSCFMGQEFRGDRNGRAVLEFVAEEEFAKESTKWSRV